MMSRPPPLFCFASLLLASLVVGCQEPSGAATPTTQVARSSPAPASFVDDTGRIIKLERRDGYGYTLRGPDGEKVGKVKVEADRVKVKDPGDALLAKVKRKDEGFKLYDGNDGVVLKAKTRGAELRLTNGAGNPVATVSLHDARALDGVGGLTAHQRLAIAVYLADVEGR